MSVIQEFKQFALRGNVIDLAVGIVIGGAFTAIVNSLVGDIIMPIVGALSKGVDLSGLALSVGAAHVTYGKFLQAMLSFGIVAFALFSLIKAMNTLKRKEDEKPGDEKQVPEDVKLLTEIRDLLKK